MRNYIVFIYLFISTSIFSQNISLNKSNPLEPEFYTQVTDSIVNYLNTSENPPYHEFLKIKRISNNKVGKYNLAGSYKINNNTLSFSPRNTLGNNIDFIASNYANNILYYSTPEVKKVKSKTAKIKEIYPLPNHTPHNAFYFHVQFSQKMEVNRKAFNYATIIDENGEELPLVWREEAFWSKNNSLLTLMIHPGKIKRGMLENPLSIGKQITLKISKDIKDFYGNPIKKDYHKTYTITKDDYESPKILFNKIQPPKVNTKKSLIIPISERINYNGLDNGIRIYNHENKKIEGTFSVKISDSENLYFFTPNNKWIKGNYTIKFNKSVSDYSLNNINRIFEVKDIKEFEKDKIILKHNFKL